jgi:hypothetical protein
LNNFRHRINAPRTELDVLGDLVLWQTELEKQHHHYLYHDYSSLNNVPTQKPTAMTMSLAASISGTANAAIISY